jgi:MoxR-like ATPase
VKTLGQVLGLQFARIQFTPDLLPADLVGTLIYQQKTGEFVARKGPVFANLLLADEINRAPAKVQSALLEAMQERKVTLGDATHPLPDPFLVFATQNPIEQEGTYPLPEAQLDRFLFMIKVDYPAKDEEREILRRTTGNEQVEPDRVLGAAELLGLQRAVREMPVPDHVLDYALALTRGTRPNSPEALGFASQWITWGAGPRASQCLVLGAKARAALAGRTFATTEDVKSVAHPVMRHRLSTNFSAAAEGISADHLIDRLLAEVVPSAEVGAGLPGVRER